MDNRRAYLQLALGTLNSMFLGIAYTWSLFVQPIESSMGWVRSQTSLIFTLMMVFFFAGCFAGSLLVSRFPLRRILLISAAAFLICFNVCASAQHLLSFYIAYGVLNGFTNGTAYFAVMNTANKWFMKRIGFASGIMLTGFALGSFILGSPISSAITVLGWRATFRCYSILFFVLMAVMAFTVHLPPDYIAGSGKRGGNSHGFFEDLRTGCFRSYFLMHLFVMTIGVTTIGNIAVLTAYTGASPAMGVIGTGSVAIGNGGFRTLFGKLYYKLGAKTTFLLVCILALTATVLLVVSLQFKMTGLLIVALFLAGASYGSVATCGSAFPMDYFGPVNYNKNFGIILTSGVMSSILGTLVVGLVQTKFGSYPLSFLVLFVYAVAACISFKFIPSPDKFRIQRDNVITE
ncbi:MAG: MFS transporter [Oscillospiraceae bacterium]